MSSDQRPAKQGKPGFTTRQVHAGVVPDPLTGAILTPIYQTTTYVQESVDRYLAKGYSYQEIADSLFISIETVRTYLRKIYEKLHVHSKVEALNKIFPK